MGICLLRKLAFLVAIFSTGSFAHSESSLDLIWYENDMEAVEHHLERLEDSELFHYDLNDDDNYSEGYYPDLEEADRQLVRHAYDLERYGHNFDGGYIRQKYGADPGSVSVAKRENNDENPETKERYVHHESHDDNFKVQSRPLKGYDHLFEKHNAKRERNKEPEGVSRRKIELDGGGPRMEEYDGHEGRKHHLGGLDHHSVGSNLKNKSSNKLKNASRTKGATDRSSKTNKHDVHGIETWSHSLKGHGNQSEIKNSEHEITEEVENVSHIEQASSSEKSPENNGHDVHDLETWPHPLEGHDRHSEDKSPEREGDRHSETVSRTKRETVKIMVETDGSEYVSHIEDEKVPKRKKSRLKCEICGTMRVKDPRKALENVVNGNPVQPTNKYPWIVNLVVRGSRDIRCSATIITTNLVLTAAHCIISPRKRNQIECKGDAVPQFCFLRPDQLRVELMGPSRNRPRKILRVRRIMPHRFFNSITYNYDIALIEMAYPIWCSKSVSPICLLEKFTSKIGDTFTTAGWGRNSVNGTKGTKLLREGKVKTVSAKSCKAVRTFDVRSSEIVCAVGTSPKLSACQGDLGSLIFTTIGEKVFGVGMLCEHSDSMCLPGVPLLYSKISTYMEWIKRYTSNLPTP